MNGEYHLQPYTAEQVDRFNRLADQTHPGLNQGAVEELQRWQEACAQEVAIARTEVHERMMRTRGSLMVDIGFIGLGIVMQDKGVMVVGAGLAAYNVLSARRYSSRITSAADQKIRTISTAVANATRHTQQS